MTLSYVHPEERGVYTCLAYNNQGNDSREVHLEVKVCSRVAVSSDILGLVLRVCCSMKCSGDRQLMA